MARCTSSSAGGCIGVLNLPALALYRTAPDYPGAMSRPAGVYCRVLGPVQVTVAGADAPPELLWRKHVALLVYLARSPRRRRTREHLVGLLWSDRDEKQARHSLSEALHVFRRVLGDNQVRADVDQIGLGADGVTLDCDRFAELYAHGDWPGAAALVEGDFLEGLSIPDASQFEDWLGGERVRWRAQSVDALVRHADGLLAQGDAAAAATAALRARGVDRASEPAGRAAMRALALAGDRAAALRVADDLAGVLADQVGTAPGPETARLIERIREARVGRPEPSLRSGRSTRRSVRASSIPPQPCRWRTRCAQRCWPSLRSGPRSSRSTMPSGSTLPPSRPCPRWRVTRPGGRCCSRSGWRVARRRAGVSRHCGHASGAIWKARSSGSVGSTTRPLARSPPGPSRRMARPMS